MQFDIVLIILFHFYQDDITDDENDDLLTVKRKDHNVEITDDLENNKELPTDISNKKKKKPLTKAAVAKKMIKKQIKPNQKTVFDETGEVQIFNFTTSFTNCNRWLFFIFQAVLDKAKTKISRLAREYENNDDIGGINIEQAKLMLREEDKYDKELFRERVKTKHREQKRLAKEEAKRAETEDVSSSDEASVDLSWLPDPDKVYGKRENDESEDEFFNPDSDPQSGSESESDEINSNEESSNIHRYKFVIYSYLKKKKICLFILFILCGRRPPKRKLLTNKTNDKKRSKLNEEHDEPLDTGLSLMEDEELVLKMLDG